MTQLINEPEWTEDEWNEFLHSMSKVGRVNVIVRPEFQKRKSEIKQIVYALGKLMMLPSQWIDVGDFRGRTCITFEFDVQREQFIEPLKFVLNELGLFNVAGDGD